ncbi:MAG: DUF4230 domain-containing protein [Muribaculaceae bacterium]|nr:DUF4230 domain-containing protein [Muribaculaceae bacterium]
MKVKLLKGCVLASALTMMSSCAKTDNNGLYQEIKSVDKMVFAKMSITKTVVNNQENILGRRIAGYSYDTYARAYIDLSSFQVDDLVFDDKTKTVKVILPPVNAELIGRDCEMREAYKNITGLRWDLDEKDINSLKEEGNKSMRDEWESNPMLKAHLIDAAKRKARKYFEEIFENSGYMASIEFKNSKIDKDEKVD